jgi:hypothetical protein
MVPAQMTREEVVVECGPKQDAPEPPRGPRPAMDQLVRRDHRRKRATDTDKQHGERHVLRRGVGAAKVPDEEQKIRQLQDRDNVCEPRDRPARGQRPAIDGRQHFVADRDRDEACDPPEGDPSTMRWGEEERCRGDRQNERKKVRESLTGREGATVGQEAGAHGLPHRASQPSKGFGPNFVRLWRPMLYATAHGPRHARWAPR